MGHSPIASLPFTTPNRLRCDVFESIDRVPIDAWETLRTSPADLAMDRRLLGVFESTMTSQCRCWYAIVYAADNTPLASACLCRFDIDATETGRPLVQTAMRRLRRLRPGFMKFGVLFCGLPVPSASSHLRIADHADAAAVFQCLHDTMTRLARRTKSRLVVIKELDESLADRFKFLESLDYVRGEIPATYELRGDFESGSAYVAALRSRYRRQIRESAVRADRAGATVSVVRGEAIAEIFDDRMHSLYLAVRERAEYKMETLPREFFESAARAFGKDASLVLMQRDGRAAGFLFGLTSGDQYHNLYVGLDYARARDADVYFNLYAHDIDRAFQSGATNIHLGQTSDDFKARLGAVGRPMFFYARALHPVLQFALGRFSKKVFPPVQPPAKHDVFRVETRMTKPETRIKSEIRKVHS